MRKEVVNQNTWLKTGQKMIGYRCVIVYGGGGGCQTKKGNKFATNEAILAKDIKISGRIRNLNVLPTRVRFQIRKKALQ